MVMIGNYIFIIDFLFCRNSLKKVNYKNLLDQNLIILQMAFLQKIWQSLTEKKSTEPINKNVTLNNEVYSGYRTIPIQKLARKEVNKNYYIDGRQLWRGYKEPQVYSYMENLPITNRNNNGFYYAFYYAYMRHGDIKLKPDEVWMTIMLWFSQYVNDHAEQLRNAFVTHQGKKQLVVVTDRNYQDWTQFFDKMIIQIEKNTEENIVDHLRCDFTSTGHFQRLFSTALIMNTTQNYFDYTNMMVGCGIVNAHMAGTLEDWQKLEEKLAALQKFDVDGQLKKYIKGLKPVLGQFTETYKGFANIQFWNNIYFERPNPNSHQYLAPKSFINGWLIKFFTNKDQIRSVDSLNQFTVSIKNIDLVTKKTSYLNLKGGCKGYSCQDDYVYTPHFSFAIALDEKKTKQLIK